MRNMLPNEQVKNIYSMNGIEIYNIRAAKFKTNTINIFFHDSLSRENAAKNALIPAVLRRGSEAYPTFGDIALYMESLYGASFDCGVAKKGERQIIQFYMDFVSDSYAGEGQRLFEKAFEFLEGLITKPALQNGVFNGEYVRQEKENLKRLIESRVNDKMQYGVERCLEEMCREEPFGIYEYGNVSDLDSIDEKNLYEHYGRFLKSLPVSIYITGDMDAEYIKKVTSKFTAIKRQNVKKINPPVISVNRREQKNITEKMDVNQGKLSLGFRTNICASGPDYHSLMVYNGILGGGLHSKLFQNVREKAGLAYYAFSRLEKFKGLMVISSGIEISNRDKAEEIILKQLEEVKKGNVSEYEYQSSVKSLETAIKSLGDSQLGIVDFYLGQSVAGTNDTFDTMLEKIKNVSVQDAIAVSQNIAPDTVYFLTSK